MAQSLSTDKQNRRELIGKNSLEETHWKELTEHNSPNTTHRIELTGEDSLERTDRVETIEELTEANSSEQQPTFGTSHSEISGCLLPHDQHTHTHTHTDHWTSGGGFSGRSTFAVPMAKREREKKRSNTCRCIL